MTLPIRQIYEDMPPVLTVPVEMRHKRVEVILLALDDLEAAKPGPAVDANGWPLDFFEKTAGCLADDPVERAPQGDYEQRLELE
jgi:hypothetical protein